MLNPFMRVAPNTMPSKSPVREKRRKGRRNRRRLANKRLRGRANPAQVASILSELGIGKQKGVR